MYFQWKKKLLRRSFRLLKVLPRKLRDPFVRSQLNICYEPIPGIVIKIAETKDEMEQAFKLVHDTYVDSKLIDKETYGLRVTKYNSLPSTTTIVVKKHNEVIGTTSIIMDSPMGLPIDSTSDISHLRSSSTRIAEISSLAIKKDFNLRRGKVMFPLIMFLHKYCEEIAGVDIMVCVVRESAKLFYEGILLFDSLPLKKSEEKYDFVNAKEICPLYLRMNENTKSKMRKVYHNKPPNKNVYLKRYIAAPDANMLIPIKKYHQASYTSLTNNVIDYFFNQRSEVFNTLSTEEKQIVQSTYVRPALTKLLQEENTGNPGRKNNRHFVNCEAHLASFTDGNLHKVKVLESSIDGFSFHSHARFKEGDTINIHINIGPNRNIKLKAKVCWSNDTINRFGASLIEAVPFEWKKFNNFLMRQTFPDLNLTTDESQAKLRIASSE